MTGEDKTQENAKPKAKMAPKKKIPKAAPKTKPTPTSKGPGQRSKKSLASAKAKVSKKQAVENVNAKV